VAKPSKLPEFALQLLHNPGPSRVDPVDLKDSGWLDGQKPPREYFNWLHWMYYEWLKYLDEENDSNVSNIQDAQIDIANLQNSVDDLQSDKLEETTGVFNDAYLKATAGSSISIPIPIRWVRHGNLVTLSWPTTKIMLSEPGNLYIERVGTFHPLCAANTDENTYLRQTMPVCVYSNNAITSQPGRLSLPYHGQDALGLYRMIVVDGVPTFNQQFPAGECGIQAGNVTYVLESIS
jgi:hypothetical protein